MKKLLLVLVLTVCGCTDVDESILGMSDLDAARAVCNESSLAGSGTPLTDAEWDDLVASVERARDEGVSRDFVVAFGNLTCGGESNELCVRCNEAVIDALWP